MSQTFISPNRNESVTCDSHKKYPILCMQLCSCFKLLLSSNSMLLGKKTLGRNSYLLASGFLVCKPDKERLVASNPKRLPVNLEHS